MKIIVIGGGAAGFFSALAAKKSFPEADVLILERSANLLNKVRISGGGRCNVSHSCFEPRSLVLNYPRGKKELIGPFHSFQPKDTIEWFQRRGVSLKTEEGGGMFPTTDSSETIIQCLFQEAEELGVEIRTKTKLKEVQKTENGFSLDIGTDTPLFADRIILATGSAKVGWEFAQSLGHTLQQPVPSLFTFNVPSFSLVDLARVSVEKVKLKVKETKLENTGPLLITHWGFSGPAALKLSALGARYLAEKKYEVSLIIDWLPHLAEKEICHQIETQRSSYPKKILANMRTLPLPRSLWKKLYERSNLRGDSTLNSLSNSGISRLCEILKRDTYQVKGKTTNKEEFVTCGGITLSEVSFKTMESKLCSHLFFCGEVLDIDGVTGGFNFQNAWTTGWLAGNAAGISPCNNQDH